MAGRVLIVDDVATNRIVLKVKLGAACYETLQAGDGETALRLAREGLPDIVLLDVMLPDMAGLEVCRKLKQDPATRDIPVIMITALRDAEARRAALRVGADDFLSKPLDEAMLLARLRSLLRVREAAQELHLRESTSRALGFAEPVAGFALPAETSGHIMLIAGRRETAAQWRRALMPHIAATLEVMPHDRALVASGPAPDLFVIAADLEKPGDGLRLMSELRSRPGTRHSASFIVLPADDQGVGAMALDLGASDLLPESFEPQEGALRLAAQLHRKRQADTLRATVRTGLEMAIHDPLTGLYNRRYALPHLAQMAARAARTGRDLAVMVLDLDRFKQVNDTLGHAAGDAVLVTVTERLRDTMRPSDLLARIGGEEFLVALPDTGLAEAQVVAERLCRAVAALPVTLPDGSAQVRVTMSVGLAVGGAAAAALLPSANVPGGLSAVRPGPAEGPGTTNPAAYVAAVDTARRAPASRPGRAEPEAEAAAHALIARADHAVRLAKAGGRNKVSIHCDAA
jgi:two-component system cell cycle response regulator